MLYSRSLEKSLSTWTDNIFQAEVTTYWVSHFETSSRTILKHEYSSNLGVQRPYKWAHLNPSVINNAIAEIWRNGQQWPRRFYDIGRSDDAKVYNWVLKWLLWHVCRYRDWRNRKARNSSSSGSSGKAGDTSMQGDYVSCCSDVVNADEIQISRRQHCTTTSRLLEHCNELTNTFCCKKRCRQLKDKISD